MSSAAKLWIGIAKCSIHIPWASSLKERRQVVRSLKDGVRSRFSISAADLGPSDVWRLAELGFAAAGSSPAELAERMSNLEKFLIQRESEGEFELTEFLQEVLKSDDI